MTTEDVVINVSDDNLDVKSSANLWCTFPPDGSGGIPIYSEDLDCLKEEQWLSDQVLGKLSMSFIYISSFFCYRML